MAKSHRRLFGNDELPDVLHLGQEQIDWLINTGQLHPIPIEGEVRVDLCEIDAIVAIVGTYGEIEKGRTHRVRSQPVTRSRNE